MAALSGGGTVLLASSGGCVTKCSYVCAVMNYMVHFLYMKKIVHMWHSNLKDGSCK